MERIMKNAVARPALAAILGLLLSFSIGCSTGGYHGEPSAWSRKGHPAGPWGKDFSERILKHMDKRVEALNLSPEQREKYLAIRERARSDLAGMRETRRQLATEMRQEIMKENPDLHLLAALLTQHAEKFQGFVELGTKRFLEFYDILDDSQKSKVIEHLRKHAARIPMRGDISAPSIGLLPYQDPVCAAHDLELTPYQQDQMASRSVGELM